MAGFSEVWALGIPFRYYWKSRGREFKTIRQTFLFESNESNRIESISFFVNYVR